MTPLHRHLAIAASIAALLVLALAVPTATAKKPVSNSGSTTTPTTTTTTTTADSGTTTTTDPGTTTTTTDSGTTTTDTGTTTTTDTASSYPTVVTVEWGWCPSSEPISVAVTWSPPSDTSYCYYALEVFPNVLPGSVFFVNSDWMHEYRPAVGSDPVAFHYYGQNWTYYMSHVNSTVSGTSGDTISSGGCGDWC